MEERFALLGRPTLIFRLVYRYKLGGVIPCVYGVTLDGAQQTSARVEDVQFV